MIGAEHACSDTATQSKGYEEAGKARSGGLKILNRNDPFGTFMWKITGWRGCRKNSGVTTDAS